jgi:uncharacterized damage-inducible protein DinB
MTGIPQRTEAAPYYYVYIDRVPDPDIVGALDRQSQETLALLSGISEERSLHKYAPDKWSIRQVLNHINDAERVFVSRAFWFARGFDTPLPSYDQNTCMSASEADTVSWAAHLEEFRVVRQATLALLRNLPEAAWARSGVASGNPITVRALAYLMAGHVAHHLEILKERY